MPFKADVGIFAYIPKLLVFKFPSISSMGTSAIHLAGDMKNFAQSPESFISLDRLSTYDKSPSVCSEESSYSSCNNFCMVSKRFYIFRLSFKCGQSFPKRCRYIIYTFYCGCENFSNFARLLPNFRRFSSTTQMKFYSTSGPIHNSEHYFNVAGRFFQIFF